MDCTNVGKLIYELRKEKEMTQKQLAVGVNLFHLFQSRRKKFIK